jgi:hypothetical protein
MGCILAVCALLIIWLSLRYSEVGSVVRTVAISIFVTFFVLLAIVLFGAVLLYRRARAEILKGPAPEPQRTHRRLPGVLHSLFDLDSAPHDTRDPAVFWARLVQLAERFGAAVRPEYLQAASDQDRILDAFGHIVYIYVRGPRNDEVRSIHRDLDREINRMADAGGSGYLTTDVNTLRRLGNGSFRPKWRDWRHLGAQLETPSVVLAGARLLLLLNRRWRESATVYYKIMSLDR